MAAGDGRVDVVFDLTPDEAHAFPASEHGKIQTKKAKTILTGVFNEDRPDSPWRNPEARRALNLAIDREFVLHQARTDTARSSRHSSSPAVTGRIRR